MSCDEAEDAYIMLGKLVYTEPHATGGIGIRSGQSNRVDLKTALERLIESKAGDANAKMKQVATLEGNSKIICHVRHDAPILIMFR